MRRIALANGPALLAACILGAAHAQAPTRGGPPPPPPPLSVGAALAVTTQPYEGAEDRVRLFPIPLVAYRGARLRFTGKTGEAILRERAGITVSAVADWRFQSYDAADSPALAGMDDRSGTLEAGVRAERRAGRYGFGAIALADALGRHGGYQLEAQAGAELVRSRSAGLGVTAALRYQSASLADYYFGVDPEEARPGRPAYETGAAILPSVGITARRSLGRRLSLFGLAQAERLPGAVTDSPIVDREVQAFGFVGLSYALGD